MVVAKDLGGSYGAGFPYGNFLQTGSSSGAESSLIR